MTAATSNTRMKFIIIAAGVVVVLLTLQVMFGRGVAKHDLLGFSPGMPRVEAEKLIDKRQWLCRGPQDSVLDCKADNGRLTLTFAKAVEDQALYRIQVSNFAPADAPLSDTAKAVSRQFGLQPSTSGPESVTWDLPAGTTLSLTRDQLQMVNKTVADGSAAADGKVK